MPELSFQLLPKRGYSPALQNRTANLLNCLHRDEMRCSMLRPYKTNPAKHEPKEPPLLVAVDDAAARQIVWRKLDRDFVSRENANKIFAHLAGDVRQDLVLVLQLDTEHGVGQRFDDRGHDFNGVLFGISRVAFVALLFILKLLRHILLSFVRPGFPTRTSGRKNRESRAHILPSYGAPCCATTNRRRKNHGPSFGQRP